MLVSHTLTLFSPDSNKFPIFFLFWSFDCASVLVLRQLSHWTLISQNPRLYVGMICELCGLLHNVFRHISKVRVSSIFYVLVCLKNVPNYFKYVFLCLLNTLLLWHFLKQSNDLKDLQWWWVFSFKTQSITMSIYRHVFVGVNLEMTWLACGNTIYSLLLIAYE